MKDPTLKPVADQIEALYGGQLSASASLEAAQNLTGLVGLLLEIAEENGLDLDDA